MQVIRFLPLQRDASQIRVEWHVDPATALYKQTSFTLDFGDALDPRSLPLKLCWSVVLLALHSHWNLLRPCRVVLPITLASGEIEFWLRLLDAERVSLESYRGTTDLARTVAIECGGELLSEIDLPSSTARCAAAFSGGKESLLQAALLAELTERPLLVNTQSEMPPFKDHSTRKRAQVLRAITERRECEVVVVKSDLRSIWKNGFSKQLGYRQTVNEMTDVFLYAATLVAVAAARGIGAACIGCEYDGQEAAQPHAELFADFYFMGSPTIVVALGRYFARMGLEFGSMLFPLSHFQIEKILWRRYSDVADLQNSCFRMNDENVSYCNRCRKCFRIALLLLALGIDPARLGIDVSTLFLHQTEWSPNAPALSGALAYATQHISPEKVRSFFPTQNLWQQLGIVAPPAYRSLKRIIRRFENQDADWVGLYRPQFLKYAPAALRGPLDTIYRTYSPELDPLDREAELSLIDNAVNWIAAPLSL